MTGRATAERCTACRRLLNEDERRLSLSLLLSSPPNGDARLSETCVVFCLMCVRKNPLLETLRQELARVDIAHRSIDRP